MRRRHPARSESASPVPSADNSKSRPRARLPAHRVACERCARYTDGAHSARLKWPAIFKWRPAATVCTHYPTYCYWAGLSTVKDRRTGSGMLYRVSLRPAAPYRRAMPASLDVTEEGSYFGPLTFSQSLPKRNGPRSHITLNPNG
jgi:hypothetical protein